MPIEVRVRAVLLSIAVLSFAGMAFADDGQGAFEQGVESFNAGDYEQALTSFRQARDEGMDRPALLLNLGVTAFRLQQWETADDYFDALSQRDDWASTGYYYRGRVAERQGQNEQAAQWFRQSIEAGDSTQAQRRSQSGLLRVEELPQPARHDVLLVGSAGYDGNPALVNDTDFAGDGEAFFDLFANYEYHLAESPWRIEGRFFAREYPGDSDLSDLFYELGTSRQDQHGAYLTRFGAAAGQFYFGGDHFQDRLQLSGGVERVTAGGGRAQLSGELNRILADSGFDELDGLQSRTSLSWRQSLGDLYYRTSYRLEWNDRDDFDDGDNQESLSPIRHRGQLLLGRTLSDSVWLEGLAGFEYSRYQGRNTVDDERVRRRDRDTELTVRMGRTLSADWQVFAAYTYWDRDSTMDGFETDRHQLRLSLVYQP